MLDSTKVSSAFKSAFGKVQTDVTKEIGNEAISTGVQVSSSTAAGEAMSPTPLRTALYDRTDGTVEFVRLELVADPSSNGHAFLARLPADYETNSLNPKRGTGAFTNSKYLHETLGSIQIVPTLYGVPYEAKPFIGGTASGKGSGTLIPPGDSRDWILNYFSGVLFQENDPPASPASPTYLECFIYIGKSIQDVTNETKLALANLASLVGAGDIVSRASNLDVVGVESIDELDSTQFMSAEWLVDVTKGPQSFTATVKASHYLGEVKYTIYNIVRFGDTTNANFVILSVDMVGDIMRLRADAKVADLVVNAVRVAVR